MKAAFLDRDGVINKEINYLHRIEDFEFTDRCIEGLKQLQILGYQLIVITNQAGIARGYYTEKQYQILTRWMVNILREQGIELLDVLHCPHHPNGTIKELAIDCDCRKPKPGMMLEAKSRHAIDLGSSIIIGDKLSDIEAGAFAGIPQKFLVKTGHQLPQEISKDTNIFDNLADVANYLTSQSSHNSF